MSCERDKRSSLHWPIENREISAGILGVLFAHYIHQSELLYSRCNVVIAIQGAVIAAGWFCGPIWGMVALLAGALMTLVLLQMIHRDRQCRNANLGLMKCIENNLLPGDEWIGPGSENKSGEAFPTKIRVGSPAKYFVCEGGWMFAVILCLLIVVDIVLAILVHYGKFGP